MCCVPLFVKSLQLALKMFSEDNFDSGTMRRLDANIQTAKDRGNWEDREREREIYHVF